MGMTPIDPRSFVPGERLDHSLFTQHGVKLLDAGSVLTAEVCRTLRRVREGGLFVSADADRSLAPASASTDVQVRNVDEATATLAAPEPTDAERVAVRDRANRVRNADKYVASLFPLWDRIPLRIDQGIKPLELRPSTRSASPTMHDLAAFRDRRIPTVRNMISRIVQGSPVDAREVLELADELIALLQHAPHRFMHIALLAPGGLEFLPDHAYTTAAGSIAVASQLGWSRADVRLAGMAGLLADVGMGLVPRRIRISDRALNDMEVNRVRRHPTFSAFLLECVTDLPESIRRAAYQHHERCDGRGYPRCIQYDRISDLALVVAVADAYAAAVEPRPYKPRLRPFEAIRELVRLCETGKLSRDMVRALVDSVGIFPVGSYVQLTNGELAQVIGVTPEDVDRPIVAPLRSTESGWTHGHLLNLAIIDQLDIRRAIDPPDAVLGLKQAV